MLISCSVTMQLILAFDVSYVKVSFSHDTAHATFSKVNQVIISLVSFTILTWSKAELLG